MHDLKIVPYPIARPVYDAFGKTLDDLSNEQRLKMIELFNQDYKMVFATPIVLPDGTAFMYYTFQKGY